MVRVTFVTEYRENEEDLQNLQLRSLRFSSQKLLSDLDGEVDVVLASPRDNLELVKTEASEKLWEILRKSV